MMYKWIRKLVKQNLRIYALKVHFVHWCIKTSKMIFGRPNPGFTERVELFYFISEYLLTTHYTIVSFVL